MMVFHRPKSAISMFTSHSLFLVALFHCHSMANFIWFCRQVLSSKVRAGGQTLVFSRRERGCNGRNERAKRFTHKSGMFSIIF